MELDRLSCAVTWHLNSFPSEILGHIASYIDAWDVGRAFCCGDQILNKSLCSASGIRSIRHQVTQAVVVSLPSMMTQLKGLKSIEVEAESWIGRPNRFDALTCNVLRDLGPQLESLHLFNLPYLDHLAWDSNKAVESKKTQKSFVFPNVRSLVLKTTLFENVSLVSLIGSHFLPNLTRLHIDNEVKAVGSGNLRKLPVSLVDLSLKLEKLHLTGCWPESLSSLTSLRLLGQDGVIYDHKTLSSLPASLTRLHILGPFVYFALVPLQLGEPTKRAGNHDTNEMDESDQSDEDAAYTGDSDDDEDEYDTTKALAAAADVFSKLPSRLLDFAYDGCTSSEAIQSLACWSSMLHLRLHKLPFGKMPKLPENLESFSLYHPNANLAAMPLNLKSLTINAEYHVPSDFSAYLPKLEKLYCSQLTTACLPFLPNSLTYLQVDWVDVPGRPAAEDRQDLSIYFSFFLCLPKGSLREVVNNLNGWTWVPLNSLGKFFYNDARVLPIHNSVSSNFRASLEPSPPSIASKTPFTGLGGSGWTSIGHAIAVDSLLLISDLLSLKPSLWRELTSTRAFYMAICYGSMNVLNWFEKMHLLPVWRDREKIPMIRFTYPVNLAFVCQQPAVVSWLMERGFATTLNPRASSYMILVALKFDCVPLLEHALSHMDEENVLVCDTEYPEDYGPTDLGDSSVDCFYPIEENRKSITFSDIQEMARAENVIKCCPLLELWATLVKE